MLVYVIIGIVVAAVIAGIVFTVKRNNEIQKNGVEADAVVSRIKETETRNEDGSVDFSYTYYVKYQTEDGQTVEAKLGDGKRGLREGDSIRIKYLPAKPKYVITVK